MKAPQAAEPLDIARGVIKSNKHMTLATAGETPWAAPVFYCADDDLNLYFTSKTTSLHGQHMARNPQIAFAIYNSQRYENGVQGTGTVHMLKGADILRALRWYKTDFMPLSLKTLAGAAAYRLYRVVPERLYVQDPASGSDLRVEVSIPAHAVTRDQVAEVLYRTMRIEEPDVTKEMAEEAAKSVRIPPKPAAQ